MNHCQGQKYGVSAAHPLAVEIGLAILKEGGNAVDASIAISFALSVLEPYGSGIGGGGVMMIRPGDNQKPCFYDYRECAPWEGKTSKLKIGIPGFVKGMEEVHADFGSLNWNTLIQPSIQIAEQGFAAHSVLIEQLSIAEHLDRNSLTQYYHEQEPVSLGKCMKQAELAETLHQIAKYGSDVFYNGYIGKRICETVSDLHLKDLQRYAVTRREVLQGSYDDFTIYSAPPPLAGSMLIQTLQMSEMMNLERFDAYSAEFIDHFARILRACYEERKLYNEDPGFTDVDYNKLISPQYCESLANKIALKKESNQKEKSSQTFDYNNTTSFAVIDADGMLVSTTNTLSDLFGSGVYVKGFFLNNQLRNFSNFPSSRNLMEPGKKPQSFIAPSILTSERENIVIGSSGGKRIPNMLARILIQHIKHGLPLQSITDAARYFIDENNIFLEKRLPDPEEKVLLERGYRIEHFPESIFYGGVHALSLRENKMTGSADPRRGGKWKYVEK